MARVVGRLMNGTSSASSRAPSGSIQNPRIGRKPRKPQRMQRTPSGIRSHRASGRSSQATARRTGPGKREVRRSRCSRWRARSGSGLPGVPPASVKGAVAWSPAAGRSGSVVTAPGSTRLGLESCGPAPLSRHGEATEAAGPRYARSVAALTGSSTGPAADPPCFHASTAAAWTAGAGVPGSLVPHQAGFGIVERTLRAPGWKQKKTQRRQRTRPPPGRQAFG